MPLVTDTTQNAVQVVTSEGLRAIREVTYDYGVLPSMLS
jgi:hypothetical protein